VSSSPLKMYEYFAAGKPVVSNPFPLLTPINGVIAFASDAAEWVSAMDEGLRSNNATMIGKRQALARENTWDDRVAFISTKIAETLYSRGFGRGP